ncbi:M43 family zinc metalloprotease [Marinoscillum sp.]|uniref:M43 family zinc metalloprotease n=1 Tax=Marinoscillum sp. TaxID=2024838 RepID=UPI003BAD675E
MRAISALIFFFSTLIAASQDRCATMQLPQNTKRTESPEVFEQWLKAKKQEKELSRGTELTQAVYQVPVVFHVIHDGSSIGFGSNISEAKIIEQVAILNHDFRRTNEDASETPASFRNVAADTEIEFVLARQDPEGLPTNGIVRLQGSKKVYEPEDDKVLMSESFWPHSDYLNIYVTDISGANLGYAQFPFSNLEGIATELENYANTDGVVLDYKWVGVNENTGSFDSYGRTATHEIGHYLGLRHVWGDGGCGFDDFCEDTPFASGSSTGCDTNKFSCDSRDMIQNYMDYTDDVCMNLFTVCQRDRMRLVLEQSPRRRSLLTSHGLQEAVLTANDLGIRSIVSPIQSDCSAETTPRVEVRNYGTNEISSFEVAFYLNSELLEQKESAVPLTTGETTIISFNSISLSESQVNTVEFVVTGVNGLVDQNNANNHLKLILAPFQEIGIPYLQDFESDPDNFRTTETGEPSSWMYQSALYGSTENVAAMAPFYQQSANFGDWDMLLTQSLDLSGLTSAQLSFKYAYAPRLQEGTNSYYLDGLLIAVSTDCGNNFSRKDIVYERYGNSLQTTDPVSTSFYPVSRSSWDEVNLNITRYAGNDQVQIAIIGINGGGNNLFVDDVEVSNLNLLGFDMGIKEIKDIPVVSCDLSANPIMEIKNYGYEDINEITLSLSANGTSTEIVYDNLDLESGETKDISVNISDYLVTGSNEFFFEITQLNGRNDQRSSNNSYRFYSLIEESEDVFPDQEDFSNQEWTTFSPNGTNQFKSLAIRGDTVLYTDNFNSTALTQSYLVSPTLGTSGLSEASMQFKYSYAQRLGNNDNLKVLLSLNCGRTYDIVLLSLNSEQMAVTNSSAEWQPTEPEHWKSQYIDLTEYVNWPDLRFAFVFTNGNGNRLFLDDINLYKTNDPAIPDLDALMTTVAVYPNPAVNQFSVSFNFSEKKQVYIQLADISGRLVFKELFSNILNDKISFQAPSQSGFYILNVIGSGVNQSKRIYIR